MEKPRLHASYLAGRAWPHAKSVRPITSIARTGAWIAVALAAAATVRLVPRSVQTLQHGLAGLGAAEPRLLVLAGVAFVAAAVALACAWSVALGSCIGTASVRGVVPRYAVGSLVNTFTPGSIGDALRITLVGRLAPQRGAATAAGVCSTVALIRAALVTALFAAGTSARTAGTAAAVVVAGVTVVAVLAFRSRGGHGRLASLTAAARGLARSPLGAARVVGWVAASTAARVAAAAACAAALGVDHPWSAAFVVVPALELATMLSLTPANIGITSAAVTFALHQRHIALGPALSAGIALHLVESCAGIVFGLGGLLVLAEPRLRRRIAAAAALGGAVAASALLAVSLVDG